MVRKYTPYYIRITCCDVWNGFSNFKKIVFYMLFQKKAIYLMSH